MIYIPNKEQARYGDTPGRPGISLPPNPKGCALRPLLYALYAERLWFDVAVRKPAV